MTPGDGTTGSTTGSTTGTAGGTTGTDARRAVAAAARERRQRADRRRRRVVVGGAAGGALAVAAIATAVIVSRHDGPAVGSGTATGPALVADILPSAPTGARTVQSAPRSVPDTSGIAGVLAWDTAGYPATGTPSTGTLGHDHVSGPVTYAVLPPVGGPHDPVWMNAGTYTRAVPSERAVHDLEHGAVWITYTPSLPVDQVTRLRAFVDRQTLVDESAGTRVAGQKSRYVDLTPWAGADLPTPIVISAWGHQLRLTDPTDPRLQRFVDVFRNSRTFSPEYGSPVDGVPVHTGGQAAADGATVANPPGTTG